MTFKEILDKLQLQSNATDIGIGTPTDDGTPMRINLAGKNYTFLVSDFLNIHTGISVTHVEKFEK